MRGTFLYTRGTNNCMRGINISMRGSLAPCFLSLA
jgi:hypothetical protein